VKNGKTVSCSFGLADEEISSLFSKMPTQVTEIQEYEFAAPDARQRSETV
jgi:hypothetical protein